MDKKQPVNWIARIAMVLLLLVLVSAHFSSGLLARYTVSASGSDSARVAVFQVTEAGTLFLEGFSLSMDPSDPDKLCATIEVDNQSETAIRCTVEVLTTGNLPLSFYLVQDGAPVDSVDISVGGTLTGLGLYAQWQDGDDSYLYHRELDHITVTLISTQID